MHICHDSKGEGELKCSIRIYLTKENKTQSKNPQGGKNIIKET